MLFITRRETGADGKACAFLWMPYPLQWLLGLVGAALGSREAGEDGGCLGQERARFRTGGVGTVKEASVIS